MTIERTSPSEDDWDNPETIALEVGGHVPWRRTLNPLYLVSAVEKTGAVVIVADPARCSHRRHRQLADPGTDRCSC